MISSAKINAQVKQIQQFDIAVSNFQMNYNSLPGDSANTIFPYPGDGDGKIEGADPGTGDAVEYPNFHGEVRYFWEHLESTGFGKNKGWDFGNVTECGEMGNQCDFSPPQLDMPPAELFPNAGIGVAYDSVFMAYNKNGYFISKWTIGNAEEINLMEGVCNDALALDIKLDDGNASQGMVRFACTNWFGNGDVDLGHIWIELLASAGQATN